MEKNRALVKRIDEPPAKIVHASVLLYKGEMVRYKIGINFWRSPLHVTFYGLPNLDMLKDMTVEHISREVTTRDDWNRFFEEEGRDFIDTFKVNTQYYNKI